MAAVATAPPRNLANSSHAIGARKDETSLHFRRHAKSQSISERRREEKKKNGRTRAKKKKTKKEEEAKERRVCVSFTAPAAAPRVIAAATSDGVQRVYVSARERDRLLGCCCLLRASTRSWNTVIARPAYE